MALGGRRKGGRSWARGAFAFLWIVLGGASSLYLYMLITDPAALGGQSIQLSAITGDLSTTSATSAPVSGDPSEIGVEELAQLKVAVEQMSQKLSEINNRLKPIEKVVGPVVALPPAASVTTSPPAAAVMPVPEAAAEAQPEPAAEEPGEEDVVDEDTLEETVVVEAEPAPPPVAVAPPEPEPQAEAVPAEPPAVVSAPMDEEPAPEVDAVPTQTAEAAPDTAPEAPAAAETPAEPGEIASLDPVELPPAANDGSTRYGIEIGVVAKRDELRPLWREYLTNHAALVAGLQPRRILAPDKKWRLIAGPFANAQDAEGACTLFKKADRPCAATVYAGDGL